MAAAASASPKNPWDHDQATKIFEGDDSASQLLKAKAVLHAQQMAKLSEQLQTLVSPARTPAPREALVKAWLEVAAALSVDGKNEQVLAGQALEKALKGLQAKRVELAQTVSEFIAMQEPGSSSSPAPSRSASVPPQVPGSGRGKDPDNDVDALDALRDSFRLGAGSKRSHEMIEATPPPSTHLRTSSVPVRVPKLPAGNYWPVLRARPASVWSVFPRRACTERYLRVLLWRCTNLVVVNATRSLHPTFPLQSRPIIALVFGQRSDV